MTPKELFEKLMNGETVGWAAVLLVLLFSLIQISPIKWNPWDGIFGWIGSKVNGKMHEQMAELKKEISDLRRQVRDLWINAHRQSILAFARECRSGIAHDAEEWNHILTVADEYETYCKTHEVSNGVVKADTAYIKDLYQQLCRNHEI